jgi:hypothetical protein
MNRPNVLHPDVIARTLLTWVLVAALVCASALSLHAHVAHAGDHGGAPAVHVIGTPCDHQPGSDSADHERHCSCQHFGGIVVPVVALASRRVAAERIVSILPPNLTHPPAAPHRPPIA